MRFEGKVAVVTGALGGIGLACCEGFAREGASIMLLDLKADDGGVADRLRELGASRVVSLGVDVGDEVAVGEAIGQCLERLGRFDILVNVAGMMIYKPLADLTGADWRRLLDVNLLSAAFLTTQALRHMSEGGAIVNVASVHARQTSPLVTPYAAAKAALESLTRSTAIEGRERSIRANAVLPGAIDTPMLHASPNIASGAEVILSEDIGQPYDVANAVLFLVSDAARFVTGASLLVDGGRLSKL